MEIGSILIGVALLVVVAFILAQPFIEQQGVRERQVTPAEGLAAERELVLEALRDLDFDHTMGKIADEDYIPQRATLVARGVELLRQLDQLAAAAPASGNGAAGRFEAEVERAVAARRKAAPSDPEAQMEAAIAAHRQGVVRASAAAPGGPACAQCGTPAQAGDRFCAKCGAGLAQTAACVQCGTLIQTGDRFCGKCGAKVADAAATGAASA